MKNLVVVDNGLLSSTIVKDGIETTTEYFGHGYYDFASREYKTCNKTKIRNIKENTDVNINGYDLKYGSSIEYDDNDEHLIYIYDENYTVHTAEFGKQTTIEENGKMCTTIEQSNGLISKSEYEKPIKSTNMGFGGRYGVSGLEYTVEIHYDNYGNLKSIISHKIPEDDGHLFYASDSQGNSYVINRGSSIYFKSDGTVESYKTNEDNEKLDER